MTPVVEAEWRKRLRGRCAGRGDDATTTDGLAVEAMDEGGEQLAGGGRRQRLSAEGGEAGVVLVELGGGVIGQHGRGKAGGEEAA